MAPMKNVARAFSASYVSKVQTTQSLAGIAATSTGDIFTPGNGYRYHIFTQTGNLYVSNGGYVDYIVIAGGGSGGTGQSAGDEGGGGGAGGMVQKYRNLFPDGTYMITIGAGGAAVSNDNGRSGSPSSIGGPVGFGTTVAIGGGYGAGTPAVTAGPGGSGGGNFASVIYGFASGIVGQGNPGGRGGDSSVNSGGGGGGAGQAGAGAKTTPVPGGAGGIGLAAFNGDPGIPPAYGTANPAPLPGRWFAGGGAGGGNSSGAVGGVGGGGNGGGPTIDGGSATTNTGSGGGGTGQPRLSGAGASGIVIIRYKVNPN